MTCRYSKRIRPDPDIDKESQAAPVMAEAKRSLCAKRADISRRVAESRHSCTLLKLNALTSLLAQHGSTIRRMAPHSVYQHLDDESEKSKN